MRLGNDAAGEGSLIPRLSRPELRAGVEAAQILDGRTPHALLIELLTDAGITAMITREARA